MTAPTTLYLRQFHSHLPIPFTIPSQITPLTSPLRQRKFLKSESESFLDATRDGETASLLTHAIHSNPLESLLISPPHLTHTTMQHNELTIISLGHAFKGKNHAKKYVRYDVDADGQRMPAYIYMLDYKALRKYRDRLYEMSIQRGTKGPRFVINDISPGKRWKEMTWKDDSAAGVLEKMMNSRLKTKDKERIVNGNEFFGFESEIVALALLEWYEIQDKGEAKFQNRDAQQWMDLLLAHDKKLGGNIAHYEERLQFLRQTLKEREESHIFARPKFTPPVEKSREYPTEMEELLNEDLLQSNGTRANAATNSTRRISSNSNSSAEEITLRQVETRHSTITTTTTTLRADFQEEVVILTKDAPTPQPKQKTQPKPSVSQLLDELTSTATSHGSNPSHHSCADHPEETPQRKRPPLTESDDALESPPVSAIQFKRPSAAHHSFSDTSAFLSPIDHVPPRKSIEPGRKSSSLLSKGGVTSRKRKTPPGSPKNPNALKKMRLDDSPIPIDIYSSSSDEATPEKLSPNVVYRTRRASLIPPLNLDVKGESPTRTATHNNSPSPDLDNMNTPQKSFGSERASENITADDLLNVSSPEKEIVSPAPKTSRSTSILQSPEVFSEEGSSQRRRTSDASHKGSESPDLFSDEDNHSSDLEDDSLLEMHPSTAPTQSPMQMGRSLQIRYSAIPKRPIISVSKESPVCMKESITVHAHPIEKVCLAPSSVLVAVICGRGEVLIYSSDGKRLKLRHRLRKSGEEYLNLAFTPDEQFLVIHGASTQRNAHFLRFVPVDEEQVDMDDCREIVEYNDKIESFILLRAAEDATTRHCLYALHSKMVKQCEFNDSWSKDLHTVDIGYHNSVVHCFSQVDGDQFLNLILMSSDEDVCVWNLNSESLKIISCTTRFEEMHAFVVGGSLLMICLWLDQDTRKVSCFALDDAGVKEQITYDVSIPDGMTPLPSLYQDKSEGITCFDFCVAQQDKKYYVPIGTRNGLVYILNATSGLCVGILKDHLGSLYQASGYSAMASTQGTANGCVKSCLFHRGRALMVVACDHNLFVYVQAN